MIRPGLKEKKSMIAKKIDMTPEISVPILGVTSIIMSRPAFIISIIMVARKSKTAESGLLDL